MILSGKCSHPSAKAKNCKYCPDCGKKIVHKLLVIKCKECGHYRKPVMDALGNAKPGKKYCFNCGSTKWEHQYYFDSNIPDKMRLIALNQVLDDEEEENIFDIKDKKVKIWVSK